MISLSKHRKTHIGIACFSMPVMAHQWLMGQNIYGMGIVLFDAMSKYCKIACHIWSKVTWIHTFFRIQSSDCPNGQGQEWNGGLVTVLAIELWDVRCIGPIEMRTCVWSEGTNLARRSWQNSPQELDLDKSGLYGLSNQLE